MNTLFDLTPALPPGFCYQPEFITKTEEKYLLNIIEQLNLQNMKFHEYVAKRKVISFGQGWSFTEQQLKAGNPIPGEFDFLINRIAEYLQIPALSIGQLLITEYPAASVINWHRDAPPYNTIVGISLLSDCIFKLRPYQPEKWSGKTGKIKSGTISLQVKRRSMYTMTGIAKNMWQHATAPVNAIRYSLTFRTLAKIN